MTGAVQAPVLYEGTRTSLQKTVDLTLIRQFIKGFLKLTAFNSGVPILFMKLTIFSCVLGVRGSIIGGGLRSMACPLISMRILLASVLNQGSIVLSYGLLSRGLRFLSL